MLLMHKPYLSTLPAGTGSFTYKIGAALTLVLTVAMLGIAIGFWSLQRVSTETERMVTEVMATERLASDLQRHVLVNVARSKAFALSSEPQVGDALLPEISQTAAQVDALLQKLTGVLRTSPEQAILARMVQANSLFTKARQELTAARDGGVTAKIEKVYTERFTPAANALQAAVLQLGDAQRANIEAATANVSRLSLTARWGLVLFGLGALLLGVLVAVWLVRNITRPIGQAVDTANRVAALDLTTGIEGHDRDEAGRLLAALHQMQTSLHAMVSQVQGASHSVAEGATQIAAGNLDFSNRTEMTAAFLQQTAALIEEVTTAMEASLKASARGEGLAQSATLGATGGRAVMSEVIQTMEDIRASSSQIVDITAVIDSIAFQTNILALNAAVEAARAGEQGRGFAVVASEVRTLANRSAVAAREIKLLIGASAEKVKLGALKVRQAREAMDSIVEVIGDMTVAMGEIHAVSGTQSQSMSNINKAVNQLDQMTQQNVAVIEESAAAAQNLQDQAGGLREVVGQFRLPRLALSLR